MFFLPDCNEHLPTINLQVQYRVEVSLSTYARRVKDGEWCFPSYSHDCPICHGQDCAVRCGFYSRRVILLFAVVEILVARYQCRRKGRAARGAHRTFSLLPQEVHPYSRYSSAASYEVLKETSRRSLTATLAALVAGLEKISMSTIYRIKAVFKAAAARLVESGYMHSGTGWRPPLVALVEGFAEKIIGLKQEFYGRQERFLLGTPSQLR